MKQKRRPGSAAGRTQRTERTQKHSPGRWAGTERVERQHKAGRLTVVRIDQFWTRHVSWRSAQSPAPRPMMRTARSRSFLPANCVLGRGLLDGRPVVVEGDDFTVGADRPTLPSGQNLTAEKTWRAYRIPIVAPARRLRRRRLGQDHRETGRAIPKRASHARRSSSLRRQHGRRSGRRARPRAQSQGWARTPRAFPLFRYRQVHDCGVCGRAAVVEALGEKRTREELGGWKVQTSRDRSTMRSNTEEEAFECARGSSPVTAELGP